MTLTVTDNFDQTATTSRRIDIISNNSRPYFEGIQRKFTLEKGKIHQVQLNPALDLDSPSLTYTLVQAPSQGTLSNCLNGTSDLTCSYQAPSTFTGEINFSYKANDGNSDSIAQIVKLRIVDTPLSIVQIVASADHTCALYENKKMRCWGYNRYGQLGLGNTQTIGNNETPASVSFVNVGDNIEQIALGGFHTCALLESKRVKCWGENDYGQLGLGHKNRIGDNELPSTVNPLDLGELVHQIAVGHNFSCALTDSGKIKCWGRNNYGQLGLAHTNDIGNDSSETSNTFTPISLGARAIKISSGSYHACALLKNGRVRWLGVERIWPTGLWSHS